MTEIRCSAPECGFALDAPENATACSRCGDLLEVATPAPALSPTKLKALWAERRQSFRPEDLSGVWRFRELLPGYPLAALVTLQEGNVPLLAAPRSAAWAGLQNLQFKHLGWNPTGCFKDLGMTVGITQARSVGARAVACASTGNTAASLAAYAARAGLPAKVYLPAGQVSRNKLAQALDFGAEIVEVPGSFDDALNTLLRQPAGEIYFLNSVNPFRIEGQKTAIFEVMEQCGWRAPDYLVTPGGNLGNSAAFGKAFDELLRFGLIERAPRLIVVQAAGANPFAELWRTAAKELVPLSRPETRATAIRIGNPRSWRKALRAVRASGGCVVDVTDEEIGAAKAVIGSDGIGCEPASATTLAGIRKLREQDAIEPSAAAVAILTGHALKDTDYILRRHMQESAWEQAYAGG